MSELQMEQQEQEQVSLELERIIFFSDAVIAIAITLLAIQVDLPADVTDINLPQELPGLLPQFGVYALSFLVIGNHWVIHHRVFRNIKRYDSTLIWLNILFLLCVAFLPVPSHVFGTHTASPAAIIFFDLCLFITGLVQASIWWYASDKHRLIPGSFSDGLIRWGRVRGFIQPLVMAISAGAALIDPMLAILVWGLIPVGQMLHNRMYPRP